MPRTRSWVSFIFAISFIGCQSDTIFQPESTPDLARGGNAPVARVSGGGTVDLEAGRSTYAFHASVTASGSVKGQAELHFSTSPINVHADVTCLVVDGKDAWLGAVVTRSNAEAVWVEGFEFVWRAQDNGEGKNADPDRVSLYYGGNSAEVCNTKFYVPQNEWTNGNVQIR